MKEEEIKNKKNKKGFKKIKNKKGNIIGIAINAKRVKNPKTVDEAFGNVFSNFIN